MQVIMGGGSSIVLLSAAMSAHPARDVRGGDPRRRLARDRVHAGDRAAHQAVLLYLVVTGTINTFQVFESIYVMTQGGPQFATITVVYRIYQTAFQQFQIGLASAQAIVLFVLTFALAAIQFRWLGPARGVLMAARRPSLAPPRGARSRSPQAVAVGRGARSSASWCWRADDAGAAVLDGRHRLHAVTLAVRPSRPSCGPRARRCATSRRCSQRRCSGSG
jgi:hypothetical protein